MLTYSLKDPRSSPFRQGWSGQTGQTLPAANLASCLDVAAVLACELCRACVVVWWSLLLCFLHELQFYLMIVHPEAKHSTCALLLEGQEDLTSAERASPSFNCSLSYYSLVQQFFLSPCTTLLQHITSLPPSETSIEE